MLLRIYSICVLFVDFIQFLIYAFCEIFVSFYQFIYPCPQKLINNEIVLIVGAGQGIGRDFAIQISSMGATVICLDRNSVENEATVKQIRILGGRAYFYTCDITNKENVNRILTTIRQDLGIITMVFHCCGIPNFKKYIAQQPSIRSTMDLSILSHFWLLNEILPEMKKNRHGHIVLLTSVAGVSGFRRQIPLTVAQFAIQGLFESLLDDLLAENYEKDIHLTLAHIYPFLVDKEEINGISSRVPNWFGSIDTEQAASFVLEGVLRNEIEMSMPRFVLFFKNFLKLLPRRASLALRDFIDTGVDFG